MYVTHRNHAYWHVAIKKPEIRNEIKRNEEMK